MFIEIDLIMNIGLIMKGEMKCSNLFLKEDAIIFFDGGEKIVLFKFLGKDCICIWGT